MKRPVCPSASSFARLVNMTPAEIQRWAKDPRAKCYSKAETRARLGRLAKLKAKPASRWTAADCAFAAKVVSFNSRMKGALERDGCTPGYTISLRNWGHKPRCAVPATCSPSKVAKGLAGQAEKAARRRRERAKRIAQVEDVRAVVALPEALPPHIELFADYLAERAPKTPSVRDVVKAYTMTRSSVQRQGAARPKACGYFPELAELEPEAGEAEVRPEDAFAHLLRTRWGKRYLDAAERGRFDRDAAWQIVQRMGCFGLTNTLMDDLRYGATEIPKLYPRIAEGYRSSDVRSWINFVRDEVSGISAAKAGFFRSLLGKGDVPTFDAREIDLWLKEEREITPEDVLALEQRFQRWPMQLRPEHAPHKAHLVHHALWDAAGGTETTHAEPVNAMRLAGRRR